MPRVLMVVLGGLAKNKSQPLTLNGLEIGTTGLTMAATASYEETKKNGHLGTRRSLCLVVGV